MKVTMTTMLHSTSRAVANGTAELLLETPMICMDHLRKKSAGIFHGDNPLNYPTTVFLAQLAMSSLITASLQFVLSPIGQTAFFCQMLGGFLLSPQGLGKYLTFLQSIYHINSLFVLNTLSLFSMALFLFLVGVKTNMRMLTASGKKAIVIGVCTFFVPMFINLCVAFTLASTVKLERPVFESLFFIAMLQAVNSFYVIACQLQDLKMLTSELGRLALSSSLISGTIGWSWMIMTFATTKSYINRTKGLLLGTILFSFAFLFIIIYILKPFIQWLIGRVQKARGVKEGHMFVIYILVLGLSLFGDCMGLNFLFGPMLVGIVVPSRPPLGTVIVEKLDTMVSILLLPMFYIICTTIVNLSTISIINFVVIEILVLVGFFTKTVATMVPCILNRMPVQDAFSMGIIMATQGIVDVLMLMHAVDLKFVDSESYTITLVSMVLISGIATPVVKRFYKPPDRYVSYKRRSIQHSKPEAELRIIACIYNHDCTPSIINLIELSNPHIQSIICAYVLHLVKQTGTASTILYAHPRRAASSSTPLDVKHFSDRIVNAFRQYENRKGGIVILNSFTAISPYVTMHEDACNLALGKRAAIIIIPFHQQLSMASEVASAAAIRCVNLNILKTAPCSVGILIDRGSRCGSYLAMNSEATSNYNVAVFFLGGQDDREALSYATRMGEHHEINVSVIHFLDGDWSTSKPSLENKQDISLTNEFRLSCKLKQKNAYKEELTSTSEELVAKIRSMENNFDIILVGRRHSTEKKLLAGLDEWNEYPELGCLGDMLASKGNTCSASILVIQQQAFVGDEGIQDNPKQYQAERESSAVIDIHIPRDNAKVCPDIIDTA